MTIDLVVTNYHTPDDLERFLGSVERFPPSSPATLTIVEVDSGSYEHEFTWADRPGRTIGVEGNIGYARACNLASAGGKGDVIALFNADVEVSEGSLDACHDALLSNPNWGVLGPLQVDERNLIRHAGIFGTLDAPVHRGWCELDRGQYTDTREAVTVSGSAYFVKRSVWEALTECPIYQQVTGGALGAFLPTQHYYEESWCSYHCHAHGFKVVYYGRTRMIHRWHQASPIGGWADQQMPESQAYFRKACKAHDIPCD